jgi:GDPmannose 4,6-dehydratase
MARIASGLQDCLYLGNMDALRDWGHAKDYVEMQWLMLQQDTPDDYVIATGVQVSVREFVNRSASRLGLTLEWRGEGENEEGVVASQDGSKVKEGLNLVGRRIVAVDPRYYRPAEVETLLGNPAKAKRQLGWAPKITLNELVNEMVDADYAIAQRDALVEKHGFQSFSHNE